MAGIASAKSQLRKHIASVIQGMSAESKSKQTQDVMAKVLCHPGYLSGERVSVYLSTAEEVGTTAVVEDLFRRGKTVFVPRFRVGKGGSGMEMLKLHSMEDFHSLPTVKWNIRQPSLEDDRESALHTGGLDVVIVPGVAFTKDGDRLGHGKGFYDSFLHDHERRVGRRPTSIALAFREQVLDFVPTTQYDVTLDQVLLP